MNNEQATQQVVETKKRSRFVSKPMTTTSSLVTKKHDSSIDDELFKKFIASKIYQGKKVIAFDNSIRSEIVGRHIKLVHLVVKKYFKRVLEHYDELIQEGCLGLYEAVIGFDPTKGNKFSAFATFWIRRKCGSWYNYHRDKVSIPLQIKGLRNKAMYAYNKGTIKLSRKEIEKHLSCSAKNADKVYDAMRSSNVFSLEGIMEPEFLAQMQGVDPSASTSASHRNIDVLVQADAEQSINRSMDAFILKSSLIEAIETKLSEEERFVFIARYGLNKKTMKNNEGSIDNE